MTPQEQVRARLADGAKFADILAAIGDFVGHREIVHEVAKAEGWRFEPSDPDDIMSPHVARKCKAKATAARSSKSKKRARNVAKSKEIWRGLHNYPGYEVSSHGRVRSLNSPIGQFLKPRWFQRMPKVVIYDAEGIRRERAIYFLMVQARFIVESWKNRSDAE